MTTKNFCKDCVFCIKTIKLDDGSEKDVRPSLWRCRKNVQLDYTTGEDFFGSTNPNIMGKCENFLKEVEK